MNALPFTHSFDVSLLLAHSPYSRDDWTQIPYRAQPNAPRNRTQLNSIISRDAIIQLDSSTSTWSGCVRWHSRLREHASKCKWSPPVAGPRSLAAAPLTCYLIAHSSRVESQRSGVIDPSFEANWHPSPILIIMIRARLRLTPDQNQLNQTTNPHEPEGGSLDIDHRSKMEKSDAPGRHVELSFVGMVERARDPVRTTAR